MKDEIRVIVKRPLEYIGHEETIPNTLEALQKLVGGYIEAITLYAPKGVVLIVDEEGRLKRRTPNFRARGEMLVGPVVAVGTDGEDFTDCPITIQEWAELMRGGEYFKKGVADI